MKRLPGAARIAAFACLMAAAGAQAGGPLSICSDKTPIAYSPPTVSLNYDLGNLGARSKAQADAIVTSAVALWTNVGTATITFSRGADLPEDVTSANYSTYLGNFSDGLNPVIYDTDGSIIDTLMGVGAKSSVLGFAGSAYYTSPPCRFAEGRAVINGFLGVSDTTMTVVLAHEIGHLIGLDHTQLDSTQGLASSNYPLMYPIAYRNTATLGDDDVSAVSGLYPDTNVTSVYGQVSGNFVLADGVTAVRGANLWATEVASGALYSVVSDYLTQGTGFFRLLLPVGTYTLRAEAIQTGFTGGSSVGPYSETSTDPSFQSPLYVAGTPMSPVTLGGGTPTQIVVTAGCSANVTFRLDGTGAVGGTCGGPPVAPTVVAASSPNPSLLGQGVTLTATLSGSRGTPTGTVDFSDGGVTIGGCSGVALVAGVGTCATSALTAGTHSITAVYSGNGAYTSGSSSPVSQVVYGAGFSNVALASTGAVASASSQLSGYPIAAVNDGNRMGPTNGFWADNTTSTFPDWVQVVFNGTKTIDRVIVVSVQDGFVTPVEPSDAMTFSLYGLVDFTVQGWNGSAWVTLGSVTGNNLVKRSVTFAPFSTDRIRVNVTNALAAYSRIVEIEAFGTAAAPPPLATPTVTLVSSLNPSTSGQAVTFTATASGSSGTPTGTIDFRDGGVSIAGCAAQALSGGVATCATSALSAATHSITAAYSGNGTYNAGTSNTVSQVVNAPIPGSTNVALASAGAVASASSTLSGFAVAAVNNGNRTGAANAFWADGTVSAFPDWVQVVFNGTKTIDRVVVYSIQDAYTSPVEPTDAMTFSAYGLVDFTVQGWNGSAWVTLGTVTGNNLVKRTVTFAGYTTDRIRVNVTNALAAYSRIVEIEAFGIDAGPPPPLAPSTVTLASSLNPSTSGQAVTFTATASGSSGTPTGTVDFRDGGVSIGGCGAQALSGGVATCTTSALSVATHSITAVYSGDGTYNTATSSTVSQVVNAAAPGSTNVALASAGAVASASSTLSGFPVAAVNNGNRTGAANAFWADGTVSAFPDSVQIVFNGSKLIDSVVVYSVQDAYTSPAEPTDAMTFSLYGLVDFTVEGWNGSAWVTLGTVTGNNLVKRTVTFAGYTTDRIRVNVTNALAAYSRIVEVEAFGIDAGPPLATPTVTLVSSLNPSTSGQAVTFTATASGSSGTPTGTVDFRDGGVSIAGCGAQALSGGVATCATSSLTVTTHSITAVYSGNGSYNGGTSNTVSQVVNAAAGGGGNVALASAGAVASASSTLSGYPVAAVNNGNRTGAGNAFWADGTVSAFPDSVQIVFNGTKTIDRVVVYSVQDAFTSPVEPTDAMTFSLYGLVDFTVEGWNGSAWVTLGTVTGNNLVKRTVTFAAYSTDRIRVSVTNALAAYSRIVEIEAFDNGASPPPPSTNVALAGAGAVASASSTLSGYSVAAVNNGNRTGAANAFWADSTTSIFPDSVQILFSGTKTIDRVVVYSVQDAYTSPAEPTDAMTFSLYGLTDFTVEGWNGSAWVTLGSVAGNNLVKRTVTFAAYATDRIRINVTGALAAYSRVVEIEAWGN